MTIKLNGEAKQTFARFNGGSAEEALRHVRIFWSVEAKKEYRKNWQFAKKVKEAQKDVLKKLDEDESDYETKKDELDTKIDECEHTMNSLHNDFWQLFELLLGDALIPQWQEIVRKETTVDGYVARDGKCETGKGGKKFAALKACIHSWLLQIMKPNVAECHCMYMQTQIYVCQRGVIK